MGDSNLNPMRSSLFTGAGTPWGAMEKGRPDAPTLQAYENDPTKYKPDMSAQMAESQRQLALQGGGAARQLQANFAKMGPAGTATADFGRRMGDLSSQTDYNQRKAAADAEFASLDMGMKQMDAINRARAAANQLKVDEYNREAGEFNNEQAGRGKFVNALAGVGGTLAGGALFGNIGASLGGQLGNALTGGGPAPMDYMGQSFAPQSPNWTSNFQGYENLQSPGLMVNPMGGIYPQGGRYTDNLNLGNQTSGLEMDPQLMAYLRSKV